MMSEGNDTIIQKRLLPNHEKSHITLAGIVQLLRDVRNRLTQESQEKNEPEEPRQSDEAVVE
jgi:hypothetical protein